MSAFLHYFPGLLLGWGLGANDTANVFGTAVSSRMVSYRLAVVLAAVCVVLGAVCQGQPGIRTLSEELRHPATAPAAAAEQRALAATITLAAGIAVLVLTRLALPVSTSQAVVGAILGVGLLEGNANFAGLGKVLICWLATPLGGALLTVILYHLLRLILRRWQPDLFVYDRAMAIALTMAGAYGAYALGANNVANVAAVFVGPGMLSVGQAAGCGGLAIAIGIVTYSKPVMLTVGRGIVRLDAFTALVTVLAHAIAVHIFAEIGVPVSTSQAIVGAVLGLALIKGVQTVSLPMLARIVAGWFATPLLAAAFAAAIYVVAHLQYQAG